MIAQSNFQEDFHNQRLIEKSLSQQFGYNLENKNFILSKNQSTLRDCMPSINPKINPRVVKKILVEPSTRLKQLNQQIYQMELQKKIQAHAEQKGDSSGQVKINDLLNQKIREYNYIIDHQQFNENKQDPQLEEKMKRKEIRDEYEVIGEKIRNNNKLFRKHKGSLKSKGDYSSQIVKLYRQFSGKISPKKLFSNAKKQISHSQQLLNQNKNKKQSIFIRIMDKIDKKSQEVKVDQSFKIKQPYISDKLIEKNKNMIRQQRMHRVTLSKWNQRLSSLSQITNNSHSYQKPLKSNRFQESTRVNSVISDLNSFEMQSNQLNTTKEQSKEFKQSVLPNYIKSKNSRYIRQAGNKFVSKFDSQQFVRSLLGGSIKKQEKPTLPIKIKEMYKRNLKIDQSLDESDKEVMRLMIEEEDDMFYWTASRNQKVNLMLKGRKHH